MIGDMIKKHRIAAKLTQEELGDLVGVSGVAIMRYEKNQRQPKVEMLKKIANALNVSFSELLGGSSSKEVMDFEEVLESFRNKKGKPYIVNGEIENNPRILDNIYEIYKNIYDNYNFSDNNGMSDLDFFYADVDLPKNLVSGITSFVLGEIIKSNIKVSNNVNKKNNEKFYIPYSYTFDQINLKGMTILLKCELGKKYESLEYLKHEILYNILHIILLQSSNGLNDLNLLTIDNEELYKINEKIMSIEYKSVDETQDK